MDHLPDLESGSSPRVRKAAQRISKSRLEGYGHALLAALSDQMPVARAWQTQCALIDALARTCHVGAIPYLRALAAGCYSNTVLYRELGFAIVALESEEQVDLRFVFEAMEMENELLVAGACKAILYKQIVPSSSEMTRIMHGVLRYREDEGAVITPRTYIAAVAHLWPSTETRLFLGECTRSSWPTLVDIASDALRGKPPAYTLV
jgi:hypothetical protein